MVGSLGPAGSGAVRSLRTTALWHLSGLLIGALSVGAALAVLGAALERSPLASLRVLAVVAALALVAFQLIRGRVVQSRRQVPDHWRGRMDTEILAWLYGVLLGVGFATSVVVSAFWVFFALTLLVPVHLALLAWGGYAITRGFGFWGVSALRGIDGVFLGRRHRRGLVISTSVLAGVAVVSQLPGVSVIGGG